MLDCSQAQANGRLTYIHTHTHTHTRHGTPNHRWYRVRVPKYKRKIYRCCAIPLREINNVSIFSVCCVFFLLLHSLAAAAVFVAIHAKSCNSSQHLWIWRWTAVPTIIPAKRGRETETEQKWNITTNNSVANHFEFSHIQCSTITFSFQNKCECVAYLLALKLFHIYAKRNAIAYIRNGSVVWYQLIARQRNT